MLYDWKKLAEGTWVLVLAALTAIVAVLSGVDLNQLVSGNILFPVLAATCGRAALGAIMAAVPKVLAYTATNSSGLTEADVRRIIQESQHSLDPPASSLLEAVPLHHSR